MRAIDDTIEHRTMRAQRREAVPKHILHRPWDPLSPVRHAAASVIKLIHTT